MDELLEGSKNSDPLELPKESGQNFDTRAYEERAVRHRRIVKSFEAKINAKRTSRDRFIDSLVERSGSASVFAIHIAWFAFWVIVNTGAIPDVPIFDPYPFNFLTMTVSLEAIALSIFVLMSQGRAKKIDDLRAELAFQVSLIAEEEVTKLMQLIAELHRHLGIEPKRDPELERMLKPLDTSEIERKLEVQLFGKDWK